MLLKKIISKILQPTGDGLIKSSLLVMVFKGFGISLGYFLTIIISKKYGPEGFGIYSIAYTTIIVFSYFSSFGLTTSILRFSGQFSNKNKDYDRKLLYFFSLKIMAVLSLLLSRILYTYSTELAIYVFKDSIYINIIKIICITAPFFTLNLVNIEFLRGLKQIAVSETFRTILIPLVCSSIILIYASQFYSIQLPIYALSIAIILLSVFSTLIILIKLYKIRKNNVTELTMKMLLKTSAPMMIIGLSSYFISNLSVYIIQIFESKYQVGIFALSLKISLFISFILVGVNTVIAPKISELYWSQKHKQLSELIISKTRFIFWLSFIVFILIVVFSKSIILLINEEFANGIIVLIILAFGQLMNATCGPVGLLLNMTGNQTALMKATLYVLITTLILNIVLVYNYGIFGAATATAISIIFKNIILVVLANKKLKIKTFYIPF